MTGDVKPLSREEREYALRNWRGMGAVTRDIDRYEATVQAEEAGRKAAEERAERAEKVVALFRWLDEEDTGPDELSYEAAWEKVADLIDALALPRADDAKRGAA